MDTVLIIGSGGREDALSWKLAESAKVGKIFCCPGNASAQAACTSKITQLGDYIYKFIFKQTEYN